MTARLVAALILVCTISACAKDSPERVRQQEALRKAQFIARQADEARGFLNGMSFVHDPRTKLCYAYRWTGSTSHYGPYSMVVPCESVPPKLLVEPSEPLIRSLGVD